MYEYSAEWDRESRYESNLGVYDGDTMDLLVDLGMLIRVRQRIRLLGVNTPELRGESRLDGIVFRNLSINWLNKHAAERWPLRVKSEKSDSFGRWLVTVYRMGDKVSLNDYLISQGSPKYVK